MKTTDIDISLLLEIKESMEDLMVASDDYHKGRCMAQILSDGDADPVYLRCARLSMKPIIRFRGDSFISISQDVPYEKAMAIYREWCPNAEKEGKFLLYINKDVYPFPYYPLSYRMPTENANCTAITTGEQEGINWFAVAAFCMFLFAAYHCYKTI